jgi:hypothetical protein
MLTNGTNAKRQIKIPITMDDEGDDSQSPIIHLHFSQPQELLSSIPEDCIVLFFNDRIDQEFRETTELFSGLGLSSRKSTQKQAFPFH